MSQVSFSELRSAVYCPRQCYYERQRSDTREPPPEVKEIRDLAFRYDELRQASNETLACEPIALEATAYRRRLEATCTALERAGRFQALCAPADNHRLTTGRDVRGIVHKVLTDPLEPSLIACGKPPAQGVWEPQSVHAVAAAKALAWEHKQSVATAWLEYPAYGVCRRIRLTTRRKARYRRALRTVQELDGPPPRTTNRSKCEACTYAEDCGVKTRSLRSLLGL